MGAKLQVGEESSANNENDPFIRFQGGCEVVISTSGATRVKCRAISTASANGVAGTSPVQSFNRPCLTIFSRAATSTSKVILPGVAEATSFCPR